MPTVRIPVELNWSGATGSPGVNIWHGRTDPGEVGEVDIDGLSAMLNTFYTGISNMYPAEVEIRFNGEAQGVGDAEGDTFTGTAWALLGTSGSGFAPMGTCMLVNWRSNTGGRRGRGRTFLGPACLASVQDNGTPVELLKSEVQADVNTLVSSSEALANGALGVYSRVENVFRDFASGDVPNKFGLLRSRRD